MSFLDSEVAKAVGKVQMQSIIHEFREAYAYLLQTAAASRDILGPLVSMTQTVLPFYLSDGADTKYLPR